MYKKNKIKYFSPNIWRLMYLIKGRDVYHFNVKRVWSRASHVPSIFKRYQLLVYAGRKWQSRYVNRWMVGFRSGEFCWNRRMAIYKAKQLRKKKKKLLKEKAKSMKSNKSAVVKTQKKTKK